MAQPNDWGPAIAAASAAIGVKLLDLLGGWWKSRGEAVQTGRVVDLADTRGIERYLRERLDTLDAKYAALNDRFLAVQSKCALQEIEIATLTATNIKLEARVSMAESERDSLRHQVEELSRRVPMTDGSPDPWRGG